MTSPFNIFIQLYPDSHYIPRDVQPTKVHTEKHTLFANSYQLTHMSNNVQHDQVHQNA
jgi:hypothetical protein